MDIPHLPDLPADTVVAASAYIASSNEYLRLGDTVNPLLDGLGHEFPYGVYQTRLSLLTLFQYRERLTDEKVSQASNQRLDWKYALHLPVAFPGYSGSVFQEFRDSLLSDPQMLRFFGEILKRLSESGFVHWPDTRPGALITLVRVLSETNWLNRMTEAMQSALSAIASQQPNFLLKIARPHWITRYTQSGVFQATIFSGELVSSEEARLVYEDAAFLLKAIRTAQDPQLDVLPEISELRKTWLLADYMSE